MATAPKTLDIPTPRVFLPLLRAGPEIRYLGAKGGRASAKSYFMAETVIEEAATRPGLRVLCAREVQKSLKESAKKLLEDRIVAMGLGSRFNVLQTEIRTPGNGMIIFSGLQDHTVESIKSMEGIDLVWLEEAETLSERSITMLDPTIRKQGARVLASWNPRRRDAPIERLIPWHDESIAVLIHATYRDNPFLSPDVIALADRHKRDQPDTFSHVWLGAYEELGSKVVIPALWVDSAVGLARKLGIEVTGKRYGALDVAGAEEGGDENGFVARHGIEITHVEKWNGLDTSLTTQKAVGLALEHRIDELQYDSASVGEGVTGEWAAMGRRGEQPEGLQLVAWNGGASVLEPEARIDPGNPKSPKNKDHYQNLKSQGWFALRKRFQASYQASIGKPYDPDAIISISEDIPPQILMKLRVELSQPQQKLSGTGKTMVDKQPQKGDKSPNLADPTMMCCWPLPVGNGYNWDAWS